VLIGWFAAHGIDLSKVLSAIGASPTVAMEMGNEEIEIDGMGDHVPISHWKFRTMRRRGANARQRGTQSPAPEIHAGQRSEGVGLLATDFGRLYGLL
jgi:hypothetical protein